MTDVVLLVFSRLAAKRIGKGAQKPALDIKIDLETVGHYSLPASNSTSKTTTTTPTTPDGPQP